MPSLTPGIRSSEATTAAMYDGLISGSLMLTASTAAVYTAMKNPRFLKATNWQSRTALAIMPPLFMYALSSEMKLNHKMNEMASESIHSREVSEWAEETNEKEMLITKRKLSNSGMEKKLHQLYKQSVAESGVRIVPGDSLGVHHQCSNFLSENPFKILAGIGIPTVFYIFRGRNDQKHLQLQSKLMHTRVFGQFAVLSMLLTLMGFKTHMDSQGKFITQNEADLRVEEMKRMRADLLRRIDFDKKMQSRRKNMLKQTQEHAERQLKREGVTNPIEMNVSRTEEPKANNIDVTSIEDA